MMTSDLTSLVWALLAGVSGGGIFFGGLWVTVRRLAVARHPAVLMVGSTVVRSALVLGTFFLFGRGQFDRMIACLGGFLVARFLVMRVTRPKPSGVGRCT